MPFLEVNDFPGQDGRAPAARAEAARRMTEALAECWAIDPDIISCYFQSYSVDSYAHGGKMPPPDAKRRIFVKLHAVARSVEMRRRAAEVVTKAAAEAYGFAPKAVVVYFFERALDEIAHGGLLQSGVDHIS